MIQYYYKYDEIKDYFDDFLNENLDYLKENHADTWRDDLHHYAFNENYYLIGRGRAIEWLDDKVFTVIGVIQSYEELHFSELQTDLAEPESLVNMYTYIVGEEIVRQWLDKNPEEEVA